MLELNSIPEPILNLEPILESESGIWIGSGIGPGIRISFGIGIDMGIAICSDYGVIDHWIDSGEKEENCSSASPDVRRKVGKL